MADEGAIIRNPMSLVLLAPVNKETPETINLQYHYGTVNNIVEGSQ